jgi:alpha-1,6-mannosyltransferase
MTGGLPAGAGLARWGPRSLLGSLGVLSVLGYTVGVSWVADGGDRTFPRYIGLFAGLFALYLLALWELRRRPDGDRALLGIVLGFGVLFRVAVLSSPVLLSSDVYRYLWDGRVQRAGISPYRYAPADDALAPLRDPAIYPNINRPDKRTVYPPGSQALFALMAGVAPDSLLAWRVLLLGCEVATGLLLLRLLRVTGAPREAVALYAWSPLVVFEGVQAGHVDVALIPAVLAALLWRQAGSSLGAGVALGVATLMKLYPGVLLLTWWRRHDWRLPAAAGGTVALGYLPHLAAVGVGAVGFLPEYLGVAEDHNIGLRALLTYPLGFADPVVRGGAMVLFFALLAAVLLAIGRGARPDQEARVVRATALAVAAYLLLVPTSMHPWYVLWIVPFLCVWPWSAWLYFSGAVTLSYVSFVVAPALLPWWAWLGQYGPLYALLLHAGWRALAPRAPARLAARTM